MLDSVVIEKLKLRYPNIHPLIFHRSVEHAKTNGELFDILESIPDKYPLVWCENTSRWICLADQYLSDDFWDELME